MRMFDWQGMYSALLQAFSRLIECRSTLLTEAIDAPAQAPVPAPSGVANILTGNDGLHVAPDRTNSGQLSQFGFHALPHATADCASRILAIVCPGLIRRDGHAAAVQTVSHRLPSVRNLFAVSCF